MESVGLVFAVIAVLGAGITYGTDAFAGIVWNTALGHLDDREMTKVVGWVHYYGDRRLPIPGAIGTVAITLSAIAAVIASDMQAGALRAVAAVLAFTWLAIYVVVAKPLNDAFAAAAQNGETLTDAPAKQAAWNRVIIPRVLLQGGVIVLALLSLI